MFEKVQIPTLGVVENMSSFICDNCDKEHFIFGEKRSDLSDRFGIETIAHIPIDSERTKPFDNYKSNDVNSDLADTLIRQIGKASANAETLPEVRLLPDRVSFSWEEGESFDIENRILRDSCKCALCVDEYSGEKTLKAEDIPSDIHGLESIPLGNYAVSIQWSDGHSSSIYPYKSIKNISRISVK
jgi:ATP-binding protein involved in chromosome partitioning